MRIKQTEAGRRLADYIRATMHHIHRAALVEGDRHVVAFGNDGHATRKRSRARREVEAALAFARANGLAAVDFGVDTADGSTWAIRFRPEGAVALWGLEGLAEGLDDELWRAWSPDLFGGRCSPGPRELRSLQGLTEALEDELYGGAG